MKALILILLFTSCSALKYPERTIEDDYYASKMMKCVEVMIGKHAIKAKIAQEICEKIHKKGE